MRAWVGCTGTAMLAAGLVLAGAPRAESKRGIHALVFPNASGAAETGKLHANLTRSNGSQNLVVLCPDGKSFLTSVYRAKLDLWMLEGFDRKTRLVDWLWGR